MNTFGSGEGKDFQMGMVSERREINNSIDVKFLVLSSLLN